MIEMLVVLLIVLSMVAMSVGVLAGQLRKAAVRGVVADIVTAAEQAHALALRSNGRADLPDYGVEIVDDGTEPPYVAVLRIDRDPDTGNATASILRDSAGEPIFKAEIPSSAVIWTGTQDLYSNSAIDQRLRWAYKSGAGTVHRIESSGLSISPWGVGTSTPALNEVWGRPMNTAPAGSLVLAPAVGGQPGLSVRSISGDMRVAIGVFPIGVAFTYEFDEG